MPSSEKLFTLDPIKTTLTKSTTDVRVQGPANRTVQNNQLLKGLQVFGSGLKNYAEAKKQEQIKIDTRLAENAAIKGEQEPAGIFGVASEAFDRIVESNTLNKTLGEIKAFRDGEEGANLVNGPGSLSEKNAETDKVFDAFLAYGYSPIQTPALQQDFRNKVEIQRNETKIEIAKVNSNRNRLQVIAGLQRVFTEAVDYSKNADDRFGGGTSNESDIEDYTREPFGVALKNNVNSKLINQLASDVVDLDMNIGIQEAKRLALQVAFQNEEVIQNPSVANELMNSEYAPGITYNALYSKGLSPANTDNDAAEIFKMRNVQLAATTKYFKDIEDNNKEARKHAEEYKDNELTRLANEGKTVDEIVAKARELGVTEAGDINKVRLKFEKYLEGEKHSITSNKGREFAKALSGQKLTPAEVTMYMIEHGISLNDKDYYIALAAVESSQIQAVQKRYDESIALIKSQRISLLKGSIGDVDIANADGSINTNELLKQLLNIGQNKRMAHLVLQEIQRMDDEFDIRASKAASAAAARDGDIDVRVEVDKFQDDYNARINTLMEEVKAGLKDPLVEDKIKSDDLKKKKEKAKNKANFMLQTYPFSLETFDDPEDLLDTAKGAVTKDHEDNTEVLKSFIEKLLLPEEAEDTFNDNKGTNEKEEPLILGKPTGRVTTEGRIEYENNQGGTSTEYTVGVKNPKINNNKLTHIPSIYNGKRVDQKEAERIIIANDGKDPETGRFITAGGNPEERSKSITFKDTNEKDTSVSNAIPTSGDDSKKTPLSIAGDKYIKDLEKILGVKEKNNKDEDGITLVDSKLSKGLPKQIAVKSRSVTEEATLGSNIYNASPTIKERKEWAASYERNVIRFRENKLTKPEKRNADRMISVLNKAKNSFKDDLEFLNISHENFLERMIGVYGAETSFGRDKNFLKTGKSETNVRGELQTTFKTFTDTLGPKGNFGPMMAKAAGYDIKKLRSMSRKQLEKILYKPDFNYLAGAAIMLYKLQYKKDK